MREQVDDVPFGDDHHPPDAREPDVSIPSRFYQVRN